MTTVKSALAECELKEEEESIPAFRCAFVTCGCVVENAKDFCCVVCAEADANEQRGCTCGHSECLRMVRPPCGVELLR
jgi:hypothetical protein